MEGAGKVGAPEGESGLGIEPGTSGRQRRGEKKNNEKDKRIRSGNEAGGNMDLSKVNERIWKYPRHFNVNQACPFNPHRPTFLSYDWQVTMEQAAEFAS